MTSRHKKKVQNKSVKVKLVRKIVRTPHTSLSPTRSVDLCIHSRYLLILLSSDHRFAITRSIKKTF